MAKPYKEGSGWSIRGSFRNHSIYLSGRKTAAEASDAFADRKNAIKKSACLRPAAVACHWAAFASTAAVDPHETTVTVGIDRCCFAVPLPYNPAAQVPCTIAPLHHYPAIPHHFPTTPPLLQHPLPIRKASGKRCPSASPNTPLQILDSLAFIFLIHVSLHNTRCLFHPMPIHTCARGSELPACTCVEAF